MNIAIGNDHRGVASKLRVTAMLKSLGHGFSISVLAAPQAADYPDYAIPVAEAVAGHQADRGILICATGHGMCIAANKVHGVRAVNCRDAVDAEMSRLHNDSNIMCLAADLLSEENMDRMVKVWLEAKFEGGRHERRLEKIKIYEDEHESK